MIRVTNIDFIFAQQRTREACFKSSQRTLGASCVCTRIRLCLHTIRNSSVLLYKSPELWPIPYIHSMVYTSRFNGAIWTPFPLSARTFRCSPSGAACAQRSGGGGASPPFTKCPALLQRREGWAGPRRLAQLSARERKGEGAERRGYSLL